MMSETQSNALIYTRDKLITGKNLFSGYVDYVFPLKQMKLPDSKTLLNSLWGLLCQKDEIKYNLMKGRTFELFDNKDITEIKPMSLDNTHDLKIRFVNKAKMFKNNFGRTGAFLLSRARLMVVTIMKDHIDHIVRIHTDGFIATKKLDIKLGTKIGDLKYEGYDANIEVKNSMVVKANFK